MKSEMQLTHQIKETTLEKLKNYFKPEIFIRYCAECKYYNRIWTCPPYSFEVSSVLEGFQYAYIIGSKIYMKELQGEYRTLAEHEKLADAADRIFEAGRASIDERLSRLGAGVSGIRILLAGRCLLCPRCTREEQLPCVYPDKAQLSLESIGFDVASICEDILEDRLLWGKEGLPEYFLLVSAIFSKEKLNMDELYQRMK